MTDLDTSPHPPKEQDDTLMKTDSVLDAIIAFSLRQKLIVFLVLALIVAWGVSVAPFSWQLGSIPRDPVPVDAIPDIGENQQIVFTPWMGRSPQDIEDQVTYPLTVALMGVPGVRTVRSFSMFGFSSIYIIFEEDVEFYWSRSRLLEKLNALPAGTLPDGVKPSLGPDATGLGQVFWYTLEGRDEAGNPTGGWDLDELRTIQDWQVRYALVSADGVSEVASIGGFVREYQIDVDPDKMRYYGVSLEQIVKAIKRSNRDVGARTIEINRAEYVVRGLGFIKTIADIENAVVAVNDTVPVFVKQVATVTKGPALRRGALDKGGAEAVGGVVVARYGENPMATINAVKAKIAQIGPSLPKKILEDGRTSQVTIVPFYDRSGLIQETLGTLNTALKEEILVTIIVVLAMVMHLRSSALISGLLPLAVLMCFIFMKVFKVDANIVALSGIAIAIGTMVDMGIVICENILRHLDQAKEKAGSKLGRMVVIYQGTREVAGAVLTAVATTIISFLPVFTMTAAEGKLFKPLAYSKTFSLVAAIIVALVIIPPMAHLWFTVKGAAKKTSLIPSICLAALAGVCFALAYTWAGVLLLVLASGRLLLSHFSDAILRWVTVALNVAFMLAVAVVLAQSWLPLGPQRGDTLNSIFVIVIIGGLIGTFYAFLYVYPVVLRWCLEHKLLFLCLPFLLISAGAMAWLGAPRFTSWMPDSLRMSRPVVGLNHMFPGLGKEFMPALDEGSFLLMPTTMPHASIGEALDVLQIQDKAIAAIPEVKEAVGKIGRVESSLDPAPVSMVETVINYHPEYLVDASGKRLRFAFNAAETDLFREQNGTAVQAPDGKPYVVKGKFLRDKMGALIPDDDGAPFRLWRLPLDPALNDGREAWPGVEDEDDIWNAILTASEVPGVTSAPKLQPIETRLVMLQTGMRAPMGIKVKGPSLEAIEATGLELERLLKEVPTVKAAAVFAERVVGKPYLEISIDRERIARYGIDVEAVQQVIEVALGGKTITSTVEGRERYGVRVRYQRERRDSIEAMERVLVAGVGGVQIPLKQLATIKYVRGPQVIKSEDTFLVSYVLFDKVTGAAEVDVVEQVAQFLKDKEAAGDFKRPVGVDYEFAGNYQNQIRATKTLMWVLPLALITIFVILYLQFSRVSTTVFIFSAIAVAWAGGFVLLWCYGQDWFLNVSVFGTNLRELFQVRPINLSVAVWVGFLALFGIATDDGVVMGTYLKQRFDAGAPTDREAIRQLTLEAGMRRIRPCLMTTATTTLALLPVLTSTGRGSDIMVPMALPTVGGMLFAMVTMFVVPVLYCWWEERQLKG